MLGTWRSHADYQAFLIQNLYSIFISEPWRLNFYIHAITKLYLLNLDTIKHLIFPCFSLVGRPSNQQPEIFRSFVLMLELGETSITKWLERLSSDPILCIIIGVNPDNVPGLGTHYNFITRYWLEDPEVDKDRRNSLHNFHRKPSKKIGKNKKFSNHREGIVEKYVNRALQGMSFDGRPEKLFQQIFAEAVVNPSAQRGLVGDTNNIITSGDGTCISSGADPSGTKKCSCVSEGNYNCQCSRKFSDPEARWGWDSYEEVWFYGYTGYFLACYNPITKVDLPIYIRLVQAQRHDSVSAIVALAEFSKLYPNFQLNTFISDSASDNYPTYNLCHQWNINPIIALNEKNKGNFKYPPPIKVDDNGTPICMGGFKMIYWGPDKSRCRLKWRCPLVLRKVDSCSCKDECSPSSYGRVVYTKPQWDFRIFTPTPRETKDWWSIYAKRTASERINARILEDYKVKFLSIRGKKRFSWFCTVAGVNIHLDAWIKQSGFNFIDILKNQAA